MPNFFSHRLPILEIYNIYISIDTSTCNPKTILFILIYTYTYDVCVVILIDKSKAKESNENLVSDFATRQKAVRVQCGHKEVRLSRTEQNNPSFLC